MTFYSILFEGNEENITKETPQAPGFSVDLNLNQIIDAITASKEEYNLQPFFYTPCTISTPSTIAMIYSGTSIIPFSLSISDRLRAKCDPRVNILLKQPSFTIDTKNAVGS